MINDVLLVNELSENEQRLQEQVLKKIAFDEIVDKAKELIKYIDINYQEEIDIFMMNKRESTKKTYNSMLKTIKQYNDIPPYQWDFITLQDFFKTLIDKKLVHRTIKHYISFLESLCTSVRIRHNLSHGPSAKDVRFRGGLSKPYIIPSRAEVECLINHARHMTKFMIQLMYWNGLRTDGVRNINIKDNREFETYSKTKRLYGTLHPNVEICAHWRGDILSMYTPNNISSRFKHLSKKLFKEKLIKNAYSCHDLRHACAVRVWEDTQDLRKVARVLGHSSLMKTDIYLRSLLAPVHDGIRLDTY